MDRCRLPSFSSLRAFEAAARHLSFRAASDELGLTQSAISHQIKELESSLGTALFARLARRVELTEAGALYFPFLRDAFDRIAHGTEILRRSGASGDLTVQVYVTMAVRWLIPRLHEFHKAHPDITVKLDASHFDWGFDESKADVGIVYARAADRADLHYTHLFDATLSPLCAPAVAQAGIGLRQPADLVNHTLIELFTAPDEWAAWLAAAGVPPIKGRAGMKVDSYLLAIEAAIDGQGVAIAPHFLVAGDLRAGRLVQPFEIACPQPGRWYFVCRAALAQDRRVALFRDWIGTQVAGDAAMGTYGRSPRASRASISSRQGMRSATLSTT
jgi:LysR family glycine cleavage system transcriptional activator